MALLWLKLCEAKKWLCPKFVSKSTLRPKTQLLKNCHPHIKEYHHFFSHFFTLLHFRDIEQLQSKVRELLENRKYMERILVESQRTKEQLQKDHEELYSKMRHAVRVMVESKRNQEELEQRLEQRGLTIQKLQRSQVVGETSINEYPFVLYEEFQ